MTFTYMQVFILQSLIIIANCSQFSFLFLLKHFLIFYSTSSRIKIHWCTKLHIHFDLDFAVQIRPVKHRAKCQMSPSLVYRKTIQFLSLFLSYFSLGPKVFYFSLVCLFITSHLYFGTVSVQYDSLLLGSVAFLYIVSPPKWSGDRVL